MPSANINFKWYLRGPPASVGLTLRLWMMLALCPPSFTAGARAVLGKRFKTHCGSNPHQRCKFIGMSYMKKSQARWNRCPSCDCRLDHRQIPVVNRLLSCPNCATELNVITLAGGAAYSCHWELEELARKVAGIIARRSRIQVEAVMANLHRLDVLIIDPLDQVELFMDVDEQLNPQLPEGMTAAQLSLGRFVEIIFRQFCESAGLP
jgi:hypothetical protein